MFKRFSLVKAVPPFFPFLLTFLADFTPQGHGALAVEVFNAEAQRSPAVA